MSWWKIAGLAGLAGVAATGAVIVRSERKRRAYTPDEVRARLHARLAEAEASPDPGETPLPSGGALRKAASSFARLRGSVRRRS